MKNLILLGSALVMTVSCQTNPAAMRTPAPPPPPVAPVLLAAAISASADRGVLMRNGTMMIMQNGDLIPMNKEITLDNGDKVTASGEILRKDGSKMKITEGMSIDKSGNITDSNGKKIENNK